MGTHLCVVVTVQASALLLEHAGLDLDSLDSEVGVLARGALSATRQGLGFCPLTAGAALEGGPSNAVPGTLVGTGTGESTLGRS